MPKGQTIIKRESSESSLTIPYKATFRDLNAGRPAKRKDLDKFNACGCGWPHHLLVPKGTDKGYPMDLFVMATDSQSDGVRIFYYYILITQ